VRPLRLLTKPVDLRQQRLGLHEIVIEISLSDGHDVFGKPQTSGDRKGIGSSGQTDGQLIERAERLVIKGDVRVNSAFRERCPGF